MPRTQISIKLDEALLARVDQHAEAAGTTRTAVIEQCVKNDLPEQEAFYRSMENPAVRAVYRQLMKPGMLRVIARLADESLSEEDVDRLLEKAPRQIEAGKRLQAERKVGKGQQEQEDS